MVTAVQRPRRRNSFQRFVLVVSWPDPLTATARTSTFTPSYLRLVGFHFLSSLWAYNIYTFSSENYSTLKVFTVNALNTSLAHVKELLKFASRIDISHVFQFRKAFQKRNFRLFGFPLIYSCMRSGTVSMVVNGKFDRFEKMATKLWKATKRLWKANSENPNTRVYASPTCPRSAMEQSVIHDAHTYVKRNIACECAKASEVHKSCTADWSCFIWRRSQRNTSSCVFEESLAREVC